MIRAGKLFITFAFILAGMAAVAAPVRLARTPDFHAGKIAFSYLGDIWVVDEDGSNPRRLTDNVARDINPRFSPDGKWIAFSSQRYGNYDVFIISADGGTARRLTFHSGNDEVVGWGEFDLREYFGNAWGVFRGSQSFDVEIWFAPEAARVVSRHHPPGKCHDLLMHEDRRSPPGHNVRFTAVDGKSVFEVVDGQFP